jgi:hypothetical protein
MRTKPKSKTAVRRSETVSGRHPYSAYEGSPLWEVVSKAIKELVENGDLSETTAHAYVVDTSQEG